jgi:hypothetical protein
MSHGAAKFIPGMNEQTASGVPSGTNEVFCFLGGATPRSKMRSEWKVGTERAGLTRAVKSDDGRGL